MRAFSLLLCGFLSACSMFSNVETQRQEIPIKDVPVTARDAEDLRKKLIVLPFIDTELQRSQDVVEAARRAVVDDLIASRQFVVVNNSDLPQDVKSFMTEKKEYDMLALSRLASSLGIAAVVEGKILNVHAKRIGDPIGVIRKVRARIDVSVQIRVFASKTGREIYEATRDATVESETTRIARTSESDRDLRDDPNLVRAGVRKAFKETLGGLVRSIDKLSWEGRVALINGEKIYINAGRVSGIQVGDILKITEDGQEVFDPETGAFLGFAPGRMKGTVEIVSYFGKDGAVGVVHSGSGFKENDRVEIY